MSEQSWWQRIRAAIEREYERRIRRASLLEEFSPATDHHHHHGQHAEPGQPAEEEDGAVIVNVPRGTRIDRS